MSVLLLGEAWTSSLPWVLKRLRARLFASPPRLVQGLKENGHAVKHIANQKVVFDFLFTLDELSGIDCVILLTLA